MEHMLRPAEINTLVDNGTFDAANPADQFLRNSSTEEENSFGGTVWTATISTNISSPPPISLSGDVRVPLYCIIFVLAVTGNVLVILTLALDHKMRTVTNVFLLNLAISDLLLAVFCMPFTLVPTIMKTFIFGKEMCVLVRYMQAVSVAVSVFTLVCISMERYFAICQPLRSRRWQTLSHSYHMIIGVWLFSLIIMIPIAVYQRHIPLRYGRFKCMEIWDSVFWERFYTITLDLFLLIIPMVLMLVAYGLISMTLYTGIRHDMKNAQEMTGLQRHAEVDTDDDQTQSVNGQTSCTVRTFAASTSGSGGRRFDTRQGHYMRQTNMERSLQAKKRAIRMLFILVLEFFVCWTPAYVMQTWIVFDHTSAIAHVRPQAMNMILLLAYVSSCTNPITYCFMNHRFRQGFIMVFRCCPGLAPPSTPWKKRDLTSAASQRTVFTSVRSEPLTEIEKSSTYG